MTAPIAEQPEDVRAKPAAVTMVVVIIASPESSAAQIT